MGCEVFLSSRSLWLAYGEGRTVEACEHVRKGESRRALRLYNEGPGQEEMYSRQRVEVYGGEMERSCKRGGSQGRLRS